MSLGVFGFVVVLLFRGGCVWGGGGDIPRKRLYADFAGYTDSNSNVTQSRLI